VRLVYEASGFRLRTGVAGAGGGDQVMVVSVREQFLAGAV
jgi:hypothetical protein